MVIPFLAARAVTPLVSGTIIQTLMWFTAGAVANEVERRYGRTLLDGAKTVGLIVATPFIVLAKGLGTMYTEGRESANSALAVGSKVQRYMEEHDIELSDLLHKVENGEAS